jgi:hypothetical protein
VPPANNLELSAEGAVVVSATQVSFIEIIGGRDGRSPSFERALIANVEASDAEPLVIVRSGHDERYVSVWLQSREQADQFRALLPDQLTPEFRAHREQEMKFAVQSAAISPH